MKTVTLAAGATVSDAQEKGSIKEVVALLPEVRGISFFLLALPFPLNKAMSQ